MTQHSWPQLKDVFAGKRIVVTGATGYVGKVWVSWMLHHCPDLKELVLLIRPNKDHSAVERFETIAATSPVFRPIRDTHGDQLGPFLNARIQVIAADISQPFAGLTTEDVDHLVGQVDAVLHFAGLTDFNPDPLRALKINSEGPAHMGDLAVHLNAPLAHVSTCYVAGVSDGVYSETIPKNQSPNGTPLNPAEEIAHIRRVLTQPDVDGRAPRRLKRLDLALDRANALGWPNIYTYTKALGERLLDTREDVTHMTIRPAIVECARNYPFAGWNEGINTAGPIVALMSTWYRHLPSKPQNHFDVIPVDTVVRGCTLAMAALLQGEHQSVYQLACSDHNPYTFEQVVDFNGIAQMRHQRIHGSTFEERFAVFMDGINAEWGDTGPVPMLKKLTGQFRDLIRSVDADTVPVPLAMLMGQDVDNRLREWSKSCSKTDKKLRRIDGLLELYKPFIWDTHWTFETEHTRSLNTRLHPLDASVHRFDTDEIVWRNYWVKVEYPGLAKWCFPLLDGKSIEDDPTPEQPLLLSVHPPKKLGKTA